MFMRIHMYISMNIYVYTCVHVNIRIQTYVYICIYYIYIHAHTNAHMNMCMQTYVCTFTHALQHRANSHQLQCHAQSRARPHREFPNSGKNTRCPIRHF